MLWTASLRSAQKPPQGRILYAPVRRQPVCGRIWNPPLRFVLAPGPKLHLLYYLLFLIFYLYNSSFPFTSLTCFITLAFVGPP